MISQTETMTGQLFQVPRGHEYIDQLSRKSKKMEGKIVSAKLNLFHFSNVRMLNFPACDTEKFSMKP